MGDLIKSIMSSEFAIWQQSDAILPPVIMKLKKESILEN